MRAEGSGPAGLTSLESVVRWFVGSWLHPDLETCKPAASTSRPRLPASYLVTFYLYCRSVPSLAGITSRLANYRLLVFWTSTYLRHTSPHRSSFHSLWLPMQPPCCLSSTRLSLRVSDKNWLQPYNNSGSVR